jgi:hypothetical protein
MRRKITIAKRVGHPLKRTLLALALLACGVARAQEGGTAGQPVTPPEAVNAAAAEAQQAQAAPGNAAAADARYDALVARQQKLEAQLREQERLLETLRKTAALPPPDAPPPAGPFLAVPRLAASGDDPELTAPLAGYSDKNFFLRDRHSWFVLVPKGRIHIDNYYFLSRGNPVAAGIVPNSASDPRVAIHDTIFIKRARLGFAGTIARGIDFRLENDFASTPGPGQFGTLADASVVINYSSYVRFEVGQFYVPLTLDNVTSENYTDFMEKAAAVRYIVPSARDIGGMLFGDFPEKAGRWYFGVFNGEGQNAKNLDNNPAIAGRLIFAPVSLVPRHPAWSELLWLGGSFWWQTEQNIGGAAAPSTSGATAGDLASFTTQGGFTIFNPVYNDGLNAAKQTIKAHLAPDGSTLKYAFELALPLTSRFGLRGEYTHQSIDVREYLDSNDGLGNVKRAAGEKGNLAGWGSYVEAYAWIGGPINVDHPGLYQVPHWAGYVPPPPPRWAVQLVAKYEHVEQEVTGLPAKDPALGKFSLDVFSAGANFWLTRHARFIVDYVMNYVGGGSDAEASALIAKNLFYRTYDHELLFRLDLHL